MQLTLTTFRVDFCFSLIFSLQFLILKDLSLKNGSTGRPENDMAHLLVSKLENPSYFNILTLVLEIDSLIKEQNMLFIKKIYAILHELNIRDYDITNDNISTQVITIGNIDRSFN